jgi:hypothetical protein
MEGGLDAALCLLGTFGHMTSSAKAVGCFRCVARHLRPGGLFMLELAHPGEDAREAAREGAQEGAGGGRQGRGGALSSAGRASRRRVWPQRRRPLVTAPPGTRPRPPPVRARRPF